MTSTASPEKSPKNSLQIIVFPHFPRALPAFMTAKSNFYSTYTFFFVVCDDL